MGEAMLPNSNEFQGYLIMLLVSLGSAGAAKYGVDGDTLKTIVTGGVALAGVIWHLARNYNSKLVHEDASVIPPKPANPSAMSSVRSLIFIFGMTGLLCLTLSHAKAADMAVKAAPVSASACTPQQCIGFYAGAGFGGNGSNADILGSGLSGSVFAGGAVPFAMAGYQYWDGRYLFALEAGIGDQIDLGGVNVGNEAGVYAYQEMQFGGNLSALIAPSQGPVTPPTALIATMMAPYASIGIVERNFANGFSTGAGAKFVLSPNLFLDIGYRYINYGSATVNTGIAGAVAKFNAENLIKVAIGYKF